MLPWFVVDLVLLLSSAVTMWKGGRTVQRLVPKNKEGRGSLDGPTQLLFSIPVALCLYALSLLLYDLVGFLARLPDPKATFFITVGYVLTVASYSLHVLALHGLASPFRRGVAGQCCVALLVVLLLAVSYWTLSCPTGLWTCEGSEPSKSSAIWLPHFLVMAVFWRPPAPKTLERQQEGERQLIRSQGVSALQEPLLLTHHQADERRVLDAHARPSVLGDLVGRDLSRLVRLPLVLLLFLFALQPSLAACPEGSQARRLSVVLLRVIETAIFVLWPLRLLALVSWWSEVLLELPGGAKAAEQAEGEELQHDDAHTIESTKRGQ